MTDRAEHAQDWRTEWCESQENQEHGLNSVESWNLREHSRIPSPMRLGISLAFRTGKITRIPIEDINAWLNSVWDDSRLRGYLERERLLWEGANFSPADPHKTPR